QIVDHFLEDVHVHAALPAAGRIDERAVAGWAEMAFEVAHACRVDEEYEWRGERNHRLEPRAAFGVDTGVEFGFHRFLLSGSIQQGLYQNSDGYNGHFMTTGVTLMGCIC